MSKFIEIRQGEEESLFLNMKYILSFKQVNMGLCFEVRTVDKLSNGSTQFATHTVCKGRDLGFKTLLDLADAEYGRGWSAREWLEYANSPNKGSVFCASPEVRIEN